MLINDRVCFSFAFQVLEYHPHPWNHWVAIGDLVQARDLHATLSIGPEQLPCLLSAGESFNMEIIIKMIESRKLINKEVLKMIIIIIIITVTIDTIMCFQHYDNNYHKTMCS